MPRLMRRRWKSCSSCEILGTNWASHSPCNLRVHLVGVSSIGLRVGGSPRDCPGTSALCAGKFPVTARQTEWFVGLLASFWQSKRERELFAAFSRCYIFIGILLLRRQPPWPSARMETVLVLLPWWSVTRRVARYENMGGTHEAWRRIPRQMEVLSGNMRSTVHGEGGVWQLRAVC